MREDPLELDDEYPGQILTGEYTDTLKKMVARDIEIFKSLEATGSPALLYISAWKENENVIWYEYMDQRLVELFDTVPQKVAQVFRNRVVDRRVYKYVDVTREIQKEVIDKEELQGIRKHLRKTGEQTGMIDAVYKIESKNNEFVWLKDQANISIYPEDKTCLSLGSLTNVTKEMEAEEALKKAEEEVTRYNLQLSEANEQLKKSMGETKKMAYKAANAYIELNQIFNATGDGMIVIDQDFNIRRANKTFAALFGMTLKEISAHKCFDILGQDFCNSIECPLQSIQSGTSRVEQETVLQLAHGKSIPCLLTATPYKNQNGELIGIVVNLKNITHLKAAEDEKIKRERLQGVLEMAGAVCHELNQPMQAVSGFSELVLIKPNQDKDLANNILTIKEKIKQMGDITSKLMRIAKYETKDYVHGQKIIDIDKSVT